jgi:hypothetical protein
VEYSFWEDTQRFRLAQLSNDRDRAAAAEAPGRVRHDTWTTARDLSVEEAMVVLSCASFLSRWTMDENNPTIKKLSREKKKTKKTFGTAGKDLRESCVFKSASVSTPFGNSDCCIKLKALHHQQTKQNIEYLRLPCLQLCLYFVSNFATSNQH